MSNQADIKELRPLLEAIYTDLAAIKSAVDAMATQLNSDEGVTDTDYAGPDDLTLNS